jgi:hypothetical protein
MRPVGRATSASEIDPNTRSGAHSEAPGSQKPTGESGPCLHRVARETCMLHKKGYLIPGITVARTALAVAWSFGNGRKRREIRQPRHLARPPGAP